MIKLSILDAVKAIKNGELSSLELIEECFKNIRENDYNAFINIYYEQSKKRAKKIDSLAKKGEANGSLLGIPISIKDNILVKGMNTTCGSLALNEEAKKNAVVVKKLLDAGAIIVGKTNMDEFAMGSSNMTSAFGRVYNPFDRDSVSGGSSGGSAVSVATNQCFASLGTDTGGSIRQPASYCRVLGLKPSKNLISKNGVYPLAPAFDQVGPLARTADDCKTIFEAIINDTNLLRQEKKQIKVGIIKELYGNMTRDAKDSLDKAVKKLSKSFDIMDILNVSVASFDKASEIYNIYGYTQMYLSLKKIGINFDLLGEEARRRVGLGKFYFENSTHIKNAKKLRQKLDEEFANAFSVCDVMITPSAPSKAFKYNLSKDHSDIISSDFYTVAPSVCSLPALQIPIEGERVGVQLFSIPYSENTLFKVAKIIEN